MFTIPEAGVISKSIIRQVSRVWSEATMSNGQFSN